MRRSARALIVALVATLAIPAAGAAASPPEREFRRVASFAVYTNNADPAAQTVAEIMAVSKDGRTLAYTDGVGKAVGFVDISDPSSPRGLGTVALTGEPTSVAIGRDGAYVGVNTSESFTDPSGHLAVVRLPKRGTSARTIDEIPLAGQPDSVAVDPSGRRVAVVIENERDEEVDDGLLPQAPPGLLQVVDLGLERPEVRDVDLTGLAEYAPEDPEPEFVDVDRKGRAVVSLQENNHIAIVDLRRAKVVSDFPAGSVDLEGIDAVEDGVISLTDTLEGVAREPDAVAWLSGGRIATANEGDLFGGSRGFTIFDRRGRVEYDSGSSFDELAVRHGHYPESRSGAKGTEPEGIEVGKFGRDELLFVGSERGSFVGVYEVGDDEPVFEQFLPTGLGPEGLLAIPKRNLLAVSTEEDDPATGVRSTITLYQRSAKGSNLVDVVSDDGPDGTPIAWSALSGMVAHPEDPDVVYAVWDSYYSTSRIFTLDVGREPAVVTGAIDLTRGGEPVGYDLEGISVDATGDFWTVSEGSVTVDADDPTDYSSTPNLLLRIAPDGEVQEEIGLPEDVVACRAATVGIDDGSVDRELRRALRYGFEGVTVTADGSVVVAQQLGWEYADVVATTGAGDVDCATLTDAPDTTKVWTYDPTSGDWSWVPYATEPVGDTAGWVGLSEVTALAGGGFVFIERDDATGDWTHVKQLARVDELGDGISAADKRTFDLIEPLRADHGWITDKPEGVAVTVHDEVFVVTDNDGVEDWSGETWLLRLGAIDELF